MHFEPAIDAEVVSAKDVSHVEEESFVGIDASMEEFFARVVVIAETMASASVAIVGDVPAKAITPSRETVPTKERASTKKEVPEGSGSVAEGISVRITTPLKGVVSLIIA